MPLTPTHYHQPALAGSTSDNVAAFKTHRVQIRSHPVSGSENFLSSPKSSFRRGTYPGKQPPGPQNPVTDPIGVLHSPEEAGTVGKVKAVIC